jgi:hypothetical protein
MTHLQLLPATLSLIVLAAHFLRAGTPVLVLLALVVAGLVLVRRPWAGRIVQWVLVIGAVEWLRTLFVLAEQRRLEGMPYTRMAVILGVVGTFTLASAALMQTRRVAEHFSRERATAHRG